MDIYIIIVHTQFYYCRRGALYMWVTKNGDKATYRALIKAFIKADKREYADNICAIIRDIERSSGETLPLNSWSVYGKGERDKLVFTMMKPYFKGKPHSTILMYPDSHTP